MKSQKQKPIEVWTNRGICVRNRVFVGGIPKSMTEVELEIVFSGLGHDVRDVRIVYDMRTGASKGYGFVTFRTAQEADNARAHKEVAWRGRWLRVGTALKKKLPHRANETVPPLQPNGRLSVAGTDYYSGMMPMDAPFVVVGSYSSQWPPGYYIPVASSGCQSPQAQPQAHPFVNWVQ